MKKGFNQQEQEYLLANRLKKPSSDLAKDLGCSKSKVGSFFKRKGLTLPPEVREHFRTMKLRGRTSFTPEMDQFLIENYLTMPVKPLGEKIGKSYCGVMIRLKQLRLEIPPELREARKQKGQIKKGSVSFNKGKKQHEFMSPEAIARTKATRFQKGNLPHNTQPIGYESRNKDGYLMIKTTSGMRYKHHVVYEQHHGKIPTGYVVRFKDGNLDNMDPNNLEAISKKEHLKKNWHEYPAPLKKAIRLTNKIKNSL